MDIEGTLTEYFSFSLQKYISDFYELNKKFFFLENYDEVFLKKTIVEKALAMNVIIANNNISEEMFSFSNAFQKMHDEVLGHFENFFDDLDKKKKYLEKDSKVKKDNVDENQGKIEKIEENIKGTINIDGNPQIIIKAGKDQFIYKKQETKNTLENIEFEGIIKKCLYEAEHTPLVYVIKENKLKYQIISSIIIAIFKDGKSQNLKRDEYNIEIEDTQEDKTFSEKLNRIFNIYYMNAKIIENEYENHSKKLNYFLDEIIFNLLSGINQHLKSLKFMSRTKKILETIEQTLAQYELENLVVYKLKNLSYEICYSLNDASNKFFCKKKIVLKNKISTSKKKLRKNKLSKINLLKCKSKDELKSKKIDTFFKRTELPLKSKENNLKIDFINNRNNTKSKEKLEVIISTNNNNIKKIDNLNNKSLNLFFQNTSVFQSSIPKKSTYSMIFESNSNLYETNKITNSKNSNKSEKFVDENKHISDFSYKNYFKDSLKTKKFNANLNLSNEANISFPHNITNYDVQNSNMININSHCSSKLQFLNVKNNLSFEENSNNRKISNITFGFNPYTSNSNHINQNSFSHESNTLNEIYSDNINEINTSFNSNLFLKKNSSFKCSSEQQIVKNISRNNSDGDPYKRLHIDENLTENFSPKNQIFQNESYSRLSSDSNNKINKRPLISAVSVPGFSSCKSTDHSVSTSSLTSAANKYTTFRSANVPSLVNYRSGRNLMSFSDGNGVLQQRISEAESSDKIKKIGVGLNNLLRDRMGKIPKTKRVKTGSSNKKLKNKKIDSRFIDMIFTKLKFSNKVEEIANCNNIKIEHSEKEQKKKGHYENISEIKNYISNGNECNISFGSKDKDYLSLNESMENFSIKRDNMSDFSLNDRSNLNKSFNSYKTFSLREIIKAKFYEKDYLLNKSPQEIITVNNKKKEENSQIEHTKEELDLVNHNLVGNSSKIILKKKNPKENCDEKIENENDLDNSTTKMKEKGDSRKDGGNEMKIRECKEITKYNFFDSLKKAIEKNGNFTTENHMNLLNTNGTCVTEASGSILRTRSGNSRVENSKENFLSKKRKNDENINTEIRANEQTTRRTRNSSKNNSQKRADFSDEKDYRRLSANSKGKISIASGTDDEILAYQTPVKLQEITKIKFSPNTIAKKNLMELFAQIKKN